MEFNELNRKAMGGTELMQLGLERRVDPALLDQFQIIASRVRELDPNRKKILWCHDLPRDPEVAHLANGGHEKYDQIVFVSHWQRSMYHEILGVPYEKSTTLLNAIEPIDYVPKMRNPEDRKVKMVYFSTPHRGLDILYAVFEHMAKTDPDIELHVYSSFKLYGWEHNDKAYQDLFDKLDAHPQIVNHGTVSNEQIRKDLLDYDILAYPSTWQETSCLCLIEAMAAGLICVHSSLGALPETSAGRTIMYEYTPNVNEHAHLFYHTLNQAVYAVRTDMNLPVTRSHVSRTSNDQFGWQGRASQWTALLNNMLTRDS